MAVSSMQLQLLRQLRLDLDPGLDAPTCALALRDGAAKASLPLLLRPVAPQLRLDAKIPGTVLLRDKNGGVFYISIDNVQQVRHGYWIARLQSQCQCSLHQ
jgi:hypothetical protein